MIITTLRFLGTRDYDKSSCGRAELHRRYLFSP